MTKDKELLTNFLDLFHARGVKQIQNPKSKIQNQLTYRFFLELIGKGICKVL